MEKIKKILIGGEKQVGKTFLVQRLAKELCDSGKHLTGYYTLMHNDKVDERNEGFMIYMYPACEPLANRQETKVNFVGSCNGKDKIINEVVFEDMGVKLLSNVQEDDVVIMDEVGFFEANVKAFTDKVFEIFENGAYVIATVKEKYDNDYINKVRGYKDREDTIFVQVTEENREEIFEQLEKIVKEW